MRKGLIAAALAAVASSLCMGVPAGAAVGSPDPTYPFDVSPFTPTSPPLGGNDDGTAVESPRTLDVRLLLHPEGGDEVKLYGLENLSDTIGKSDESLRWYDFGRRIGDDLGLARDSFEVSDSYLFEPVVTLKSDDRLVHRDGKAWKLDLDTSPIVRSARLYGFTHLDLTVCPSKVGIVDDSRPSPEQASNGCRSWHNRSVGDVAPRISIVEHPSTGRYWRLVGVMAAGCATGALVMGALAVWIRRKFLSTLGPGTVMSVLMFTILGAISWAAAAATLAEADRPVSDILLERDGGLGDHVIFVAVPALMFALPFIVPAVIWSLSSPASAPSPQMATGRAPVNPAAPGLPSWMMPAPAPPPGRPATAPPPASRPIDEPSQSGDSVDPPPPPPPPAPRTPRPTWEPPA